MNSIIACATQTHKTTTNQDYASVIDNVKVGFRGVIVADGIGSHSRSELSSNFCAEKLKEKLEEVDSVKNIDFKAIFSQIKNDLIEFADINLTTEEKVNNPFGTTLLCVLDLEDEYQIAYVGNGSIWQISGDFNHFGVNRYLPWNSINLLNPHTIEEDGKSKLYRFLSISETINPSPSTIIISKNETSYGDIIVIASDGVYTNDEVRVGKDDNGIVWMMGDETMLLLYETLKILFQSNPQEIKDEDVKFELEKYLNALKEKKIMHDDTTLGIIISSKVIQHQQSKLDKSQSKINSIESNSN